MMIDTWKYLLTIGPRFLNSPVLFDTKMSPPDGSYRIHFLASFHYDYIN